MGRFLEPYNEMTINTIPTTEKAMRPAIKADEREKSYSPVLSGWIAALPMMSIKAGSLI